MVIRTLSLCTGAGGLELGLRLADPGHRTICYVERDHFAAGIIAARIADGCLDDAPIWDDVGTFDGSAWCGSVDLITAGFPCQPVSQAGKRLGQDDDRFIWAEIARIIREVRPGRVLLENVSGILSHDRGRTLGRVIGDLAELSYDAVWDVFSAAETGAPQLRRRWYCLAVSHHFPLEEQDGRPETGIGSPRRRDLTGRGRLLVDTEQQRLEGQLEGRSAAQAALGRHTDLPSVYPPWRTDDRGWIAEIEADPYAQPSFRREADGMDARLDRSVFAHRSHRLRAVGNGVVPLAAGIAWRVLNYHMGIEVPGTSRADHITGGSNGIEDTGSSSAGRGSNRS